MFVLLTIDDGCVVVVLALVVVVVMVVAVSGETLLVSAGAPWPSSTQLKAARVSTRILMILIGLKTDAYAANGFSFLFMCSFVHLVMPHTHTHKLGSLSQDSSSYSSC